MEERMPAELPIACSLDARELGARLARIAGLGRDALLATAVDGRHAELRFRGGSAAREHVYGLVAAESECCAFLTMRVDELPGEVRLTIDAPEGAELPLHELVAAFGLPARAPSD
jgi:hypothetical protein